MLRLKILRKQKHLSMKELGNKFNVAESTISLYESGKRQPDKNMIIALSDFFGVSVDYLLGREFKVTFPVENWHASLQEDYKKADADLKEYMLYKHGKVVFSDDGFQNNQSSEYSEEEKKLLSLISKLTDEEAQELSNYIDFIISKRK